MAPYPPASGIIWLNSPPHGNTARRIGRQRAYLNCAMKPFAVLLILGGIYTYAAMRTKTLLAGPGRKTLCEYILTKRACSVLAKF